MKPHLRFGAAIVTALVTGFFIGRENQTTSHQEPAQSSGQRADFENDALGFLNWFRLSGRDEITRNELVRNLRILESKAIASGKLTAFRGTPSDGEGTGKSDGEISTE